MIIQEKHSHRHAETIMSTSYPQEKAEIEAALIAAPWVRKAKTRCVRNKKGKITQTLTLDQKATNAAIETEFKRFKTWEIRPPIVSNSPSKLVADFKRSDVQVEVQFGNAARYYADIYKFLLSYSFDDIEVGVLCVPMLRTAKCIDQNVANFERVVRELPHAKMGITIPIWVLGVEH